MKREDLIDFSRYIINEDGTIWSKYWKKYINGNIGTSGYLQVWLTCKDGIKRYFMKHRVIASYFISNPENKPQVDHINTVKTDNRIENLRWVTQSENNLNEITRKHLSDGQKNGGNKIYLATEAAAKVNRKPVYMYSLNGEFEKKYNSVKEASIENNCLPQNISACCLNKKKTCNGHKWYYEPL